MAQLKRKIDDNDVKMIDTSGLVSNPVSAHIIAPVPQSKYPEGRAIDQNGQINNQRKSFEGKTNIIPSKIGKSQHQQNIRKKLDDPNYRKNLYAHFENAMQKYHERSGESAIPLKQNLSSRVVDFETKMKSVNPVPFKFGSQKSKFYKIKNVFSCFTVHRFFIIDDDNFTYYATEDSSNPKKKVALRGAKVTLDTFQEEVKPAFPWVDAERKSKYRVIIQLAPREKKSPIFVYDKNLDFLKSLIVKLRVASNPEMKKQFSTEVNKINQIFKINQFAKSFDAIKAMYYKRDQKMVSFQKFGKNLCEAAAQNQQRSIYLWKKIIGKIGIESTDQVILGRTFRQALMKQKSNDSYLQNFNSSLFLQRLNFLSNFIKTRRLQRDSQVQLELKKLLLDQIKGYRCPNVLYTQFNQRGHMINQKQINQSNAIVTFGHNKSSFITIENMNRQMLQQDNSLFLERDYMMRIDLSDINYISTNSEMLYQRFNPGNNNQYNITLYGPCIEQSKIKSDPLNVAPEHSGLAPLISLGQQLNIITVHSILMPFDLVSKINQTSFIKVKMTQGVVSMQTSQGKQSETFDAVRMYYVLSSDLMMQVDEATLKSKPENVLIHTRGMQFKTHPIVDPSQEKFFFEVLVYNNEVPVPNATKSLKFAKQFSPQEEDAKGYAFSISSNDFEKQNAIVQDYKGTRMAINFSFKKQLPVQSQIQQSVNLFQGHRLLVGRFVLNGQHKQSGVISVTSTNQTIIKKVHKGKSPLFKKDTFLSEICKVNNIQRIEKYGVSIYNDEDLPSQVSESKYLWKCSIKADNPHMLSTLVQKISEAKIKRMNEQVPVLPMQYMSQNSGIIVCQILQARNLGNSPVLKNQDVLIQPHVEISIHNISENNGQFLIQREVKSQIQKDFVQSETETTKRRKLISWVNNKHPHGELIKLKPIQEDANSESNKNNFLCFKVYNNQINQTKTLLGQAYLQISKIQDPKNLWSCKNLLLLFEQKERNVQLNETTQYCDTENADHSEDSLQAAGTLLVQFLYKPEKHHAHNLGITENLDAFPSPEAYLHYKLLKDRILLDKFNYKIPVPQYNPNDYKVSLFIDNLIPSARPMLLQYERNVKDDYSAKLKQLVDTFYNLLDQEQQKNLFKELEGQRLFASPQEIVDIMLWASNRDKKPILQEFASNFQYLWLSHLSKIKYDANKKMTQYNWQKFIGQLLQNSIPVEQLSQQMIERQSSFASASNASFLSGTIKKIYDLKMNSPNKTEAQNQMIVNMQDTPQRIISLNASYVPLKGQQFLYEQQQSQTTKTAYEGLLRGKKVLGPIIFSGVWEDEGNQIYTDLFYLVKAGIPDELRILVWSQMLRTELIEIEEKNAMQKDSNQNLIANVSLYEQYKLLASHYDCLSFKQIDEDISNFDFSSVYCISDNNNVERDARILEQKVMLRNVLRALVVWNKKKEEVRKKGQETVCFTYSFQFMKMIQKLFLLSSKEEDCFWLIVGIIKAYPRPFSTSTSVLLDEQCNSVMRYEMTAFKAILQQNASQVHAKLKSFGLPIEMIIYKPIMSFYSEFFISDITFRLWDQIIFNLCHTKKDQRKKALWWLISPALFVIKQQESKILEAKSIDEIIMIFNDGGSSIYDPDDFILKIDKLNKEVFVEGEQKKSFFNFFGSSTQAQNMNAVDMEEQRGQLTNQIEAIFGATQKENQQVESLLNHNILYSQEMKQRIEHLAFEGRKQFNRQHNDQQSVDKVYLYLHNISKLMGGIQQYRIEVQYGKNTNQRVDTFQKVETGQQLKRMDKLQNPISMTESEFQTELIDTFNVFQYKEGCDTIRINVVNNQNITIGEAFILLKHFPVNRFVTINATLLNKGLLLNENNFVFNFSHLKVSCFIETKTNQNLFRSNDPLFRTLLTVQMKMPDRMDIFNLKQSTISGQLREDEMVASFIKFSETEFAHLRNCLKPDQQDIANEIINESYNYCIQQGQVQVKFDEFRDLAKKIIPKNFNEENIKKIYFYFTGDSSVFQEDSHTFDTEKRMLAKSRATATRNTQIYTSQLAGSEQAPVQFQLRSFLVSLVLMSQNTVREKLGMLFDIFDIVDGTKDGLKTTLAFELVETIFQRNMCFWPKHELHNQLEKVFFGSVSSIYGAYWAQSINEISMNQKGDPNYVKQKPVLDLTQEVQHTLTNYFSVFGTKDIDFNCSTSPFQNLRTLIGEEKLRQVKRFQNDRENPYKLIILSVNDSERFFQEVVYEIDTFNLTDIRGTNKVIQNPKELSHFMERISGKLILTPLEVTITKQDFLNKVEKIPLFSALIRVETFFRDLKADMTPTTRIEEGLNCVLDTEMLSFIFRFRPRDSDINEGQLVQVDNVSPEVVLIEMNAVCMEDTFVDIRTRIQKAFHYISIQTLPHSDENVENVLQNFKNKAGVLKVLEDRRFFSLSQDAQPCWSLQQNEFARLESVIGGYSSVNLKFSKSQEQRYMEQIRVTNFSKAIYDCFSLYKHADQSYQWRRCRIVKREPKAEAKKLQNSPLDVKAYSYMIEFQHMKKHGSLMWCKREANAIIFSSNYTRMFQFNFQKQNQDFIKETYMNYNKQ